MPLTYDPGMRVLAITHGSDLPEAHLLIGLSQSGIEIDLIVHPESPQRDRFIEAGLDPDALPIRSRWDPGARRILKERIQRRPVDIIHSFTNRGLANALAASRGAGAKHIGYRGRQGNVSRWDPGSWLTYLHPRVSKISCVSDGVRESLQAAGVAPGRLVTIYKGHDVEWYAQERLPDLGEFDIPKNAFVIGCAANMRSSKGSGVLIESARRLASTPALHFLLMGEVRDPSLRAEAAECAGRVHLTGFRRDARNLLGACDLCVMSSFSEGLPKGVIEAMAQGVPVVASGVGGLKELVVDGECGLLVPPGDPGALADAISMMASDPGHSQAMGLRAKQRIVDHFHPGQTLEKTLALYRDVLG